MNSLVSKYFLAFLFISFQIKICKAQEIKLLSNQGHTSGIADVQYSKDGSLLLSGSANEWILWEARTGRVLFRYAAEGKLQHVSFSSDESFIVAADKYLNNETHIKRWDAKSRVLLENISQDSLRKEQSYKDVLGVFYQESNGQLIWADDGTVSIYNERNRSFNCLKDINGKFNYFTRCCFSDAKLFLTKIDYNGDQATSTILFSTVNQAPVFREFTIKGNIDNFYYCKENNSVYSTLNSGELIKIDLGSSNTIKYNLPDFSPSVTRIYQTNDKRVIYISYSSKLAKLAIGSGEISIEIPNGTSNSDYKLLTPNDPQTCLMYSSGYLPVYTKFKSDWRHTSDFGNDHIEGDGQFSYFGDNKLFIHANYIMGTLGFFVDLNTFKFFECNDPAAKNTMLKVSGVPSEKKELICTYKLEGSNPNFVNHYFIKEYAFNGSVTDSIDVNSVVPQMTPNDWVTFYLTPNQKQIVLEDTSGKFLSFVSRSTKRVEAMVSIPSPITNRNVTGTRTLIFGPEANQVIYASNKIIWFDLAAKKVIKVIDSTATYSTYQRVIFDHDSTSLVYKDFYCERYDLKTGKKDTLKSLFNASVLKPVLLGKRKIWLVGFRNGNLELRDSSLIKILNVVRLHNGTITDIYYDAATQRIWTMGEDNRVCITDGTNLKPILAVILQKDKGEHTLFAYNPKGEYFYPAFSTSLMHLATGNQTFDFSSFDYSNNRPDKIAATVSNDSSFVRQLRMAYSVRQRKAGFTTETPVHQLPAFKILGLDTIPAIKETNLQLFHISVGNKNGNLKALHIVANGVPVYGANGLFIPPNAETVDAPVALIKGINYLQFFVGDNKGNTSLKEDVNIEFRPPKYIRKKIILIGIGVGNYTSRSMFLPYAVKDITDLDSALKSTLASELRSTTMLDSAFSQKSLDSIRNICERANPEDIIMIYYSGHGTRGKDQQFLFCPYNTDFADPDHTGVRLDQLLSCFDHCKSRKRMLVIDACESGEYFMNYGQENHGISDLTQQNKDKINSINQPAFLDFYSSYFSDLSNQYGVQILSSAYGTKEALMGYHFHNSVFTYCFLQAFDEFKSIKQEKTLASWFVKDLRDYLTRQVPIVSHNAQIPATVSFNSEDDWEITPLVSY
jgi:hypothetical protein